MLIRHIAVGICGFLKSSTFGLIVVLTASTARAEDLTIVSWGGAYSASQNNAYHKPYMAKNPGVKIIVDYSSVGAAAKLRAMKKAGNITWDLVDVVASDAMRLCDEGLAMKINHDADLAAAPDGTPASEDFGGLLVSECFVPQIVYSTTFGYRTDVAAWGGKTPDDICDVFDLETFPGKRSLEKRPFNNMEWALLCDGIAKNDIYDVLGTEKGQARALAKLDTIKDNIVWWSEGGEAPWLLADKEVVIGSAFNGRLFSLIEEQKLPVAMLWDAQVFDLDGWIIPAGLPDDRKAMVMDYLKFATDTQRLADQAKYIPYGPARKSSAPLVGKHASLGIDMAPHMPTDPNNAGNTFLFNHNWWASNGRDIGGKFNAWISEPARSFEKD